MKKKVAMAALLVLVVLLLTACGGPEATYKKGQELLAKGNYSEAAMKFESLGGYEDAANLTIYCKACALCESGNLDAGIDALEKMGDYKDCKMRIPYYTARSWDDGSVGTTSYEWMEHARSIYNENPLYLDSADRIAALNTRIEKVKTDLYNAAVENGENGRYDAACETFNRLGYYKDSQSRFEYYGIRKDEDALANSTKQDEFIPVAKRYTDMDSFLDCDTRAATLSAKADEIVANRYTKVTALISDGKYAEAEAELASFGEYGSEQVTANYYTIAEKYLAQGAWDEASAAFKKAGDYSDASSRITEPYYTKAESLLQNGNYIDAYTAFKNIGGYKDSAERALSVFIEYKQAEFANASVGDYVTFGTYKNREIEWLVVTKMEDRMIVLSRDVLDYEVFDSDNSNYIYISWSGSDLRRWLNSDFFNAAFSDDECALILSTVLPETEVEILTINKVFLLSCSDAESLSIEDRTASSSWYLRTVDSNHKRASIVSRSGEIVNNESHKATHGVRPAIMLNLKPLE